MDCQTSNDERIFIGNWKVIPKENFLTSLQPGRYFLQSDKVVQSRLRVKLDAVLQFSGEVNSTRKGSSPPTSEPQLKGDKEDLGRLLVTTVDELAREINRKIDDLSGVQGGEDDPILQEMYNGLDELLAMAYDNYIEVQKGYWRISNRQHILIDITSAPGLHCRQVAVVATVESDFVVENSSQLYTVIAKFPDSFKLEDPEYYRALSRNSITFIPFQMAELCVNVSRLEKQISKTGMDALWKSYWGSINKGKKKMPGKEKRKKTTKRKVKKTASFIPLVKRLRSRITAKKRNC